MGTLSILFMIKIMVNSKIFITHKSEYRFFEQDEIQKSHLNGEKQSFTNEVISVFQVII